MSTKFPRVIQGNDDIIPVVNVVNADGSALGAYAPATVTLLTNGDESGDWVFVPAGMYNWNTYGVWDGASAQFWKAKDTSGTGARAVNGLVVSEPAGYPTETGDEWTGIELQACYAKVVLAGAGASTSLSSELEGAA